MSLKNLSREAIEEMSMIEMARQILEQENKAIDFRELFDQISALKQFSDGDKKDESFAQFYTDLNIDGSFLTLGSNLWGLKQWYPVEQIEEEITTAPKKKKKKKKAATKKRKKEEVLEEAADEELDLTEEELDFDDDDLTDDLDELDDFDDYDDDLDESDDDSDNDYDEESDDEDADDKEKK